MGIKLTKVFGFVCAVFMLTAVQAQALGGADIMKLADRGTWQAEETEYGNWTWKEDHTVCFRISNQKGKCADTGSWKIDGNVICYELSWYGKSVGINKNCFTVRELGNGRYETRYHGGAMVSSWFKFKIEV